MNKADISREDRPKDEEFNEANSLLSKAGFISTPFGAKHTASVAIHYYETPSVLQGHHVYQFAIQKVGVGNLEEGQCDFGLKELARSLMASFGKEPPRTRE